MKKLLLLIVILLITTQPNCLYASKECIQKYQITIKACDDYGKECEACLKTIKSLAKKCDLCKPRCTALTQHCKVALVYCNRFKASYDSYASIKDAIARDECIVYGKKFIHKNKNFIDACTENTLAFKTCPNLKPTKDGVAHLILEQACNSCKEEGLSCNKAVELCIERFKN